MRNGLTPGQIVQVPMLSAAPGWDPGAEKEAFLERRAGIVGDVGIGPFLPGPVAPNGIAPLAPVAPGGTAMVPAALPAIVGGVRLALWIARLAAQIARFATFRGWSIARAITYIRTNVWAIAKVAGWVAAGVWLADLLNLPSDEGQRSVIEIAAEGQPKRRKRYSIGYNPRVRTLQKVARHTMKLLKRHEKYIREFFPKKSQAPALAARERAHHRLLGKAID